MRRHLVILAAAATASTLAGTAVAAPIPDPVEAGRFAFDRSLVLPTPGLSSASPIIAAGGLREGGLSSLQVVAGSGNRRFLSVSDRGPNGQPAAAAGGRSFPSPSFAPTIYELQAEDDGRLSVLSRTQIRVPGNDPLRVAQPSIFPGDASTITGFRNVAPLGLDDNMYLQTGDRSLGNVGATPPGFLPTDPYGLDTEGLQRDPRDGSYWLSEEYRPSIVHLDRSGVMLARTAPVGSGAISTDATRPLDAGTRLESFYNGSGQPKLQELLPAEWKARRQNRGLEGLALSADGTKLYAMMQNPLDTRSDADVDPLTAGPQELYARFGYGAVSGSTGGRCDSVTPGPENNTANPAASPPVATNTTVNMFRNTRIVELDISDPTSPRVTGEYLYRLDLVSSTSATVQARQRVSDIAWAGPGRLIVDEHDDDAPVKQGRHLYEVTLAGATNLATTPAYATYAARTARIDGVGGKTVAQPLGCYLDNGTAAELAALPTPVTPVAKSAYLDLGATGVGFDYNKVEGVTLLEGGAGVALINDNDFGFNQGDDLAISPAADPSEQLRMYAPRPTGTAPTVTGTPQVGRTLTCAPGTYGGSGSLAVTYGWQRGGTAIPAASDPRLVLTADEVGLPITCTVDAVRAAGPLRTPAATQTSAPTAVVAAVPTPTAPATGGGTGTAPAAPSAACRVYRRGGRATAVVCTIARGPGTRVRVTRAGRTLADGLLRSGAATLHLPARTRGTLTVVFTNAAGMPVARRLTTVR